MPKTLEACYNKQTELHCAALDSDVVALTKRLTAGDPVDAVDVYGRTALLYAAQEGAVTCFKKLVEHGANLFHTDLYGFNIFILAAQSGEPSMLHYLLTMEIPRSLTSEVLDLNAGEHITGKTALHYAAEARNSKMADLLARTFTVKVDSRDHLGKTPLMLAAGCGDVATMRALIANEASIVSKDCSGKSVFAHAVHSRQALELLLSLRHPDIMCEYEGRTYSQIENPASASTISPKACDALVVSPQRNGVAGYKRERKLDAGDSRQASSAKRFSKAEADSVVASAGAGCGATSPELDTTSCL